MFTNITIPQLGLTVKQPLGLFINNEFVASSTGDTIDTYNPCTKELITSFYAGSEQDVDRAVLAARNAYENSWRYTTPRERADLLDRLYEVLKEEKHVLGAIEALDAGKPFNFNAAGDVEHLLDVTKYYAGAADKFNGGESRALNQDKFSYTVKEPYGVVAQIIPWNYPLSIAGWKIKGCLAAGNCIVIKPAENTSLSLLYFAQMFVKAGFPPGVVNVVPGYGNIVGARLSAHPDVDKISFTGSTEVGQKVMSAAALSNMKDVKLECGGKSPAVVFEDADLENTIKQVAFGIYYNTGQCCSANSRIYVQDSIYDKFIAQFREHVTNTWKYSANLDVFDDECVYGPLISQVQFDRVCKYINHGKNVEKLECIEMGEWPEKGYFIPPIFFLNVPQDSKLMKEEIFGPVAVIAKFHDYDEVIKKANDSKYGLAACVFTENVRLAQRFIRDARAGTVWVNSSNDEEVILPFGGYKMSGIGRELGAAGMDSYLQTKAVLTNL
ncbi:HCL102Cp [Eremothecium sinecaudum]|uniref:HCL102Cp n=1 Tax=Eremothecium sinecaudum TaxID=45286 RepID=A0A0X8HRE3_9SACH|nr:HCL102Cp [Eremothecium sinecaudum]AMD20049.1 HCL102Cp [Eremothecium sinecaudum]